jgi:uncharacterized membrane protein YoaK (UPF0700 family)
VADTGTLIDKPSYWSTPSRSLTNSELATSGPAATSIAMTRTLRRPAVFAASITALAGFLDAVGYAQLQHLYVSFMSGNSTQFGMSFGSGQWVRAAEAGFVIMSFVAGAFAGTIVADFSARFVVVAVLGAEIVLLFFATVIAAWGPPEAALLLVAFTMGSQNTLHQAVAEADIGKSFITGALFGLGQSLARWVQGRGTIDKAAAHTLAWTAFVCGVAVGTVTVAADGLAFALAIATTTLSVIVGLVCGRCL